MHNRFNTHKRLIIFIILITINFNSNAFVIKLLQDLSVLTNALEENNKRNRETVYNGIKLLFSGSKSPSQNSSSQDQAKSQDDLVKEIEGESGSFRNFFNRLRNPDLPNSNKLRNSRFTFSDLAGTVPQDVHEIVDFLRWPERFRRVGAKMPKGILLVGPPGTGKTSIARAIAGESNSAFFSASGSGFIELYVGMGPKRVRELFDQARDAIQSGIYKKAIIFIDELDAIGGQRTGEANSEYRNTLNELLNQMDGFKQEESIIVIGASNTPESIDSALKRPGRFDRIVYVGLPDEADRLKILDFYSRSLACDYLKLNLSKIAKATESFSPAELKNLVNEAAIRAARESSPIVEETHFEQAFKSLISNRRFRN